MKKVRQSNFELLRIIAMFMIILHHLSYHGKIVNQPAGPVKFAAQFYLIGGALGVTLFMLISSYFLIDTKFSVKRIIRIWFELFVYSVVFSVLGYFLKFQTFTYKVWLQAFMPVSFNAAWFATVYIFICFISPFLNYLIKGLNRRSYISLLSVLFLFTVGIQAVTFVMPQRMFFNSVSWFVYMYLFAGYIKRYSIKILDNKIIALSVFFISLFVIWGSQIWFEHLGKTIKLFADNSRHFIAYDNIFMVLAAVSLFMVFKNLHLKNSVIINTIAKTAFGVYLIHDNSILRMKIWGSWIDVRQIQSGTSMIFGGLIIAVCIYAICSLIDWVRIFLIEKPLFKVKVFDNAFSKFDSAFTIEKCDEQ